MADKEKRLRKILLKIGKKGVLKHVETLEEAHVVLLEDHTIGLYKKEDYQHALTDGYDFSEKRVYFLAVTNPRYRQQVIQGTLSLRCGGLNRWL